MCYFWSTLARIALSVLHLVLSTLTLLMVSPIALATADDYDSSEKIKITLTDEDEGLKIKQNAAEFQFQANLMWDYDSFDGIHNEGNSGNASELRHTDLTFKSQYQRVWQAKLKIDIEQSEDQAESLTTTVSDAYIRYHGWDNLNLTVGRAKEPFGLEQLISADSLTVIERAMVISAFSPERHVGVSLAGEPNHEMTWAVGVYEASRSEEEKRSHYAVTGRLTYALWHDHESRLLHLGIAGSLRDLNGEEYKIKERAEVHTADKIVSSSKTETERMNLLGLETAWVTGPFSLQAEYIRTTLNSETEDDAHYAGYYVQASYFLTGESRPYKDGVFESIKPQNPRGAWELVSRYSVLDAEDHGKGTEATNITVGLNYYLSKRVRLMANYIHTQLTEKDPDEKDRDDHGQAFSLRLQYVF